MSFRQRRRRPVVHRLDDYLTQFARVFLGDGAVDEVRILKPETLALMTTNRLTDDQRLIGKSIGMPVFGPGAGFGLGVAVVMDPAHASIIRGKGGVGTVGWPVALRRLVAGRPHHRNGRGAADAQYGGAGTNREGLRPGRLRRDPGVPWVGDEGLVQRASRWRRLTAS